MNKETCWSERGLSNPDPNVSLKWLNLSHLWAHSDMPIDSFAQRLQPESVSGNYIKQDIRHVQRASVISRSSH